ncbi:hypothetical protein K0M31_001543 [Melipona bicolor]|uniref:Uncharacterized protein n=1 Tax=Melipona bicolor TaxID=60889 RepID=A0AA40KXS9_9HYME|nr:hypothetical protein K0M31_001543 [Melipona bicolor]
MFYQGWNAKVTSPGMNKFFVREDPVKKDDKSSELNKREMNGDKDIRLDRRGGEQKVKKMRAGKGITRIEVVWKFCIEERVRRVSELIFKRLIVSHHVEKGIVYPRNTTKKKARNALKARSIFSKVVKPRICSTKAVPISRKYLKTDTIQQNFGRGTFFGYQDTGPSLIYHPIFECRAFQSRLKFTQQPAAALDLIQWRSRSRVDGNRDKQPPNYS